MALWRFLWINPLPTSGVVRRRGLRRALCSRTRLRQVPPRARSEPAPAITNARIIKLSGKGSAAFTLTELIVVVGIIAILSGIILPAVVIARQRATSSTCVSNLRQLNAAIAMYSQDNSGLIPP